MKALPVLVLLLLLLGLPTTLYDAFALSHNVSLQTHLNRGARDQLELASPIFLAASKKAQERNYTAAFGKARAALVHVRAAGAQEPMIFYQVKALETEATQPFVALLGCAIDDARVEHAAPAGRAQAFLDKGNGKLGGGNSVAAVVLFRRAWKQVGRFAT